MRAYVEIIKILPSHTSRVSVRGSDECGACPLRRVGNSDECSACALRSVRMCVAYVRFLGTSLGYSPTQTLIILRKLSAELGKHAQKHAQNGWIR